MLKQIDEWFVALENRLDRVKPASTCLCGLSLRVAVMLGAALMAVTGCYFLIHSPYSMYKGVESLFNTRNVGMAEWAFVYVHLYLICLHLLTTIFLLYAVPLAVLACRSAYLHETKFLRSYFRMNVQTVVLVVMGAFFNLLLDNTVCMMNGVPIENPESPYVAGDAYSYYDPDDDEHCNFGSNFFKLVLFMGFAILYVYLAWITYCYRREQEQGSQLDDDVLNMAESAAADMRRDRPVAPIGPAGDVEM